ncbi:hypothetical protein BKA69DRAFT_663812 [Paraphysoderma sedebokerense]|nr:hypothetical protein BKA69DRAFT_663812 [Paraphysoderma sedebokerense]
MDDEKEGKPSNRPKLIPSFVEGSLNCPPSLDFGIFGHISYITPSRGNYEPDDDHDESHSQSQPGSLKRPRSTIGDWIVQGRNKASHWTLKPICRLQQVWKGSNDYIPLESTPAEKSYKQKIGSLLRDFPELNMPENLLKSFMKFDYNFRKRLSSYDPTMGNVVCSLDFRNRGVAVLSPSGLAGQVLGLSRLAYDEEETVPKLKLMGHSDSYEFKTPINQITAVQFDSMNIIAARTHGHITFLSCKPSPYFNSYTTFDTQLIQPLDEIHLLDDPFHVTINPFYPGEAACVSDDGFIHIWSLEGSRRKSRMRSIVDPIDRGDSRTVRWMSCEYGVSPKDLLVASEKDVHLMDIRNQLTCVVASREYISVLDTRYPLKPVIQWSHHQHYEPPSLIHLVSPSLQHSNQASFPQQSIILSANRRSREIIGYAYADSSPTFLSTHSNSLFMNKSFSMLNAVPYQSLSSPFNIPSSRSNETLRPYTETSMHHNIHQITFPNEPPLTGICSLARNLTKQNYVSVVQCYADGSLYSQLLKVDDQTSLEEGWEWDPDFQTAGQPEEGEEKLRTHKYFLNELLQDPVHKHHIRRYDYLRKSMFCMAIYAALTHK